MKGLRKLTYLDTYIKVFKWISTNTPYSVFLIFSVLLLIISIEFLLYSFNSDDKTPFLYDKTKIKNSYYEHSVYGLDPLLGWAIDTSKTNGRIIKKNSIYLENLDGESSDTLTIFITGGSTSDIIILSYNWPILLFKKLKEEGLNFKIYVGAIGGFGLSQEVLKLIRDGLKIDDLDIHISYFGANEFEDNYVTPYENDLYNNLSSNSSYLPNIFRVINKYILKKKKPYITPRILENEAVSTYNNLKIMKSISSDYGYIFIPIFQPVVGLGGLYDAYEKYNLEKINGREEIKKMTAIYRNNYYSLINMNNYNKLNVLDFTNLFDNINEYPFYDDCHVKRNLQYIISDSIYNVLFQRVDRDSFISKK